MSKVIKTELETVLNTNVTTTAIKWYNTSNYTLNGVELTDQEINDLQVYIAPRIIPIQSPRDLISDPNGVNYEVFFQIDIYFKRGVGTGEAYNMAAVLDTLYRDTNFNGVVCEQVDTLSDFHVSETEFRVLPVRVLARVWG